jgi:hypothetical protein
MSDPAENASETPDGASPAGRRLLLRNGYEPLPICGKAPYWKEWRSAAVTAELLSCIEGDPRYASHTNTGVKTGHLAVADIDVVNPEHAAIVAKAITNVLGLTEVERIGSKGKALCYYNPDPITKVIVRGIAAGADRAVTLVEFLGDGNQMAAYGIHPGTGKPYDWPNAFYGDDLLGTPIAKLTQVSPEGIKAAAEAARAALAGLGYCDVIVHGLDSGEREPSRRTGEPVSVQWLASALKSISPTLSREDWLRVLWAVKECNLVPHLDDAERIELLNSWSSGELGEDGQPGGYMGYSDVAYNYDWAQGKTGKPVSIGTVYKIAEQDGFRGGPPRVDLMAMACANDNLVEGAILAASVEIERGSRWPKLTRRGAEILEMRPAGMLVPDWLRDKGFTIILAQRGTGKTVLAVDLALSIAAGRDWMAEPVAQGFHAVYLCGEDQENTAAHITAWCKRHSSGVVPDRFTFIDDVPDLTSGPDCVALAKHVRSFVPVGQRAVIVADTWQRATSRAKDGQNNDRDMAQAVENLESLAREFDGPAIGCFHPPKADKTTVHGSSVTENTSTGIWLLTNEAAGLKLEVTRIKGPGLGNYKYLAHEKVALGRYDAFGRPQTGMVAVYVGGNQTVALDRKEMGRAARQAVLAIALELIGQGVSVVRGNGNGQTPRDVAEAVRQRYGFRLDKRTVLDHLSALEREGKLIYVAADKNRRTKAGFQRGDAESSAESLPKAVPNDTEGI